MRNSLSILVLALSLYGGNAYALSEWQWHKSANGAHPDGAEQQQLWLMNRARQDPAAEGRWLATSGEYDVTNGRSHWRVNRTLLRDAFDKLAPRAPAAHDVRLQKAARQHSYDQIARDVQDHVDQVARADAQGFRWMQFRGNVYSYAQNSLMAHAAFNIDWGHGAYGMQTPPGHRLAIMSVDGDYTNVGIANVAESNSSTKVGPVVITQNFARAQDGVADHYNRFIVGTVWKDTNGNDRYDPGEGYGGVTVTPNVGGYYAVTASGGGFAIPATQSGQVSLSFSGGGVLPYTLNTYVGSSSVLLDYRTDAPMSVSETVRSGPIVDIAPGPSTARRYGNDFGSNDHERTLVTRFAHPGSDIMLNVLGFDIDRRREVDVYLNGRRVGTMSRTANNRFGTSDRFFFPASRLLAQNKVEFRQRYSNERWGVTRLSINLMRNAPTSTASVGSVDQSAYGHRAGSAGNRMFHRATFNSSGADMLLRAWGYDIDTSREVEVVLNNRRIGWMKRGPNNGVQKTAVFSMPASAQVPGDNFVEFRSRGDAWAVSNIEMNNVTGPVVALSPGQTDAGLYGWQYGSAAHRTVVRAQWIGTGADMVLSATGFDVTTPTKISVYLNGTKVGFLDAGGAGKEARMSRIILSRHAQISGLNTVEFRNQQTPGTRWGVSRIAVIDAGGPEPVLTPGNTATQQFGWHYGDSEHRALVRTTFNGGTSDYEISVDGFDLGENDASVWLNGRAIGFLPATAEQGVERAAFVLPKSQQRSGSNVLEFRSGRPGERWGVGRILLKALGVPTVTLIPQTTDYGTYGWGYADGDQREMMRGEFVSDGTPLELSAIGFGLTGKRDVAVLVNGRRVGYLRSGGASAHSPVTSLFVPAGLQVAGANTVEFVKTVPGGRWGVTSIRLSSN